MKIVASFSNMQPTTATVKRNGVETQINAEDLVPGDIVRVRLGEKVPADCRVISCDNLQVNTSQLTGESAPITCTVACTEMNFMESTNLIFYSSLVVQGAGEAIVVNIGDATVLGQVGKMTRGTGGADITGLHREINRFVLFVAGAALLSIILIWITWLAWLNVTHNGYISVNGKQSSSSIVAASLARSSRKSCQFHQHGRVLHSRRLTRCSHAGSDHCCQTYVPTEGHGEESCHRRNVQFSFGE